MYKLGVLLIAVVFFAWIIPLGFFIKPEAEKLACDGQRAFCLCSHLVAKQESHQTGQTVYQTTTAPAKENASSGSAGNYFMAMSQVLSVNQSAAWYYRQMPFLYAFNLTPTVEHIPKA